MRKGLAARYDPGYYFVMWRSNESEAVPRYLTLTRALGDETRVRALLALAGGELCLCQIVELLGLAPSTVSKHMKLLHEAGLVSRRKDGRWSYFRLAGAEAPPAVRRALDWTLEALAEDPGIREDRRRLSRVRAMDLQELVACCYRG
jgi:DNA-binding transcriptional ArsR family regulator